MPTESEIEAVALAIKTCTDGFDSPVKFYVEPEALHRWEVANPDGDSHNDANIDELESYRIIARAALEAAEQVRESNQGARK